MNILKAAQTDGSLTARGLLQINVVSNQNNFPSQMNRCLHFLQSFP